MDKIPVITPKRRGGSYRLAEWLASGLLIDRLGLPSWVWGAYGVLLLLWTVVWITLVALREYREPAWDKDVRVLDQRLQGVEGRLKIMEHRVPPGRFKV